MSVNVRPDMSRGFSSVNGLMQLTVRKACATECDFSPGCQLHSAGGSGIFQSAIISFSLTFPFYGKDKGERKIDIRFVIGLLS